MKAVRRYHLLNIIVVARSLNYQNEKPVLFKQSQKVRHNCTKHRSNRQGLRNESCPRTIHETSKSRREK